MAVTGQPKDPEEALLAGRPLMFVGGDDEEGGCLALGHPENIVLLVQAGEFDGGELADHVLADDVKTRWNLHHDLVAQVEALKTAVRGLLPLAQERAQQFRKYADGLAKFIKETGTTPEEALTDTLKLRQAEAEGAELVVGQARELLKGAGHGA